MGTKTITMYVSDLDQSEIPAGQAYQLSIRHPDGSTQQLDISEKNYRDLKLAGVGKTLKKRGRKPGSTTAADSTPRTRRPRQNSKRPPPPDGHQLDSPDRRLSGDAARPPGVILPGACCSCVLRRSTGQRRVMVGVPNVAAQSSFSGGITQVTNHPGSLRHGRGRKVELPNVHFGNTSAPGAGGAGRTVSEGFLCVSRAPGSPGLVEFLAHGPAQLVEGQPVGLDQCLTGLGPWSGRPIGPLASVLGSARSVLDRVSASPSSPSSSARG